jgi:AraC-like DNA-binding protein
MKAKAKPPTFSFSTAPFPAREQAAAWREHFGRIVAKLDIEPFPAERFYGDVTFRPLPGLGFMHCRSSGARFSMTKELIENDDLGFSISPTGSWAGAQIGRDVALDPGDATLMSNGDLGSITMQRDARVRTLRVPRNAIAPLVSDLGALFARRIPRATPALRLLVRYLDAIEEEQALTIPELQHAVVTHVHDLLAVVLGATRDAAEIAEGRGVRAARLRAIKSDIIASLHRSDLSVGELAAQHRITPRYVQALFESEGTTFSQFVLAQRLVRTFRALSDRRFADRRIAAIAFDAGFGDLSYFNRAFRRYFGAAPSDVRAESLRRDGT